MNRTEAGENLGRSRYNNTSNNSIFSPEAGEQWFIELLKCTNVTTSVVKVRVFVDPDGTTYSEDTAEYYDTPIQPGQTLELAINYPLYSSAGNVAVYNSVANSVNFRLFGYEITK